MQLYEVPSIPGCFVTEEGLVYNTKSSYRITKIILLHQWINKSGYYLVCVNGKERYVHTLVLETFIGQRPKGQIARHLDGKHTNNSRYNLVWGTPKENEQDKIKHGGNNSGSKNGMSKLTEQQVIEIRSKFKSNRILKNRRTNTNQLAQEYNVSRTTIYDIVGLTNKNTWSKII